MRLWIVAATALFLPTSLAAQVYVQGHTKKDGTYVAPHYRSNPDSNVYNNWSTKGNVNPYTGQAGTKNPYGTTSSYSNPHLSSSKQSNSSTPKTCYAYTPC